MENPQPEALYGEGIVALTNGNMPLAERKLRAAILNAKERGQLQPPRRYYSYLGLAMSLANRPSEQSLELCQKAVDGDPTDPVLLHNLGRLHILMGNRTKALTAFAKGLHLAPHSKRLRSDMKRFNRRRKPPIGSLDRNHPINRHLGRIRANLFGRRAAPGSARTSAGPAELPRHHEVDRRV